MSRYGFDLDGTLDREPIRQLARDLFEAGHKIYIVTGGLEDSGEWTAESRMQRLKDLGVPYTNIVRCLHPDITKIGAMKGDACRKLGIALLIDDSMMYITGASPSVCCLLVQ